MSFLQTIKYYLSLTCLLAMLLPFSGCVEMRTAPVEPFYGVNVPPRVQEFRWSNGILPKTLDPALASAPPETDVVRALFEGLTDLNPKTLEPVPAIAVRWEHSDDFRTWTFYLRKNARWTNGEKVTAVDFERSWKRLSEMGEKAAHQELLENIVGGVKPKKVSPATQPTAEPEKSEDGLLNPFQKSTPEKQTPNSEEPNKKTKPTETNEIKTQNWFGVQALNENSLRVWLAEPDKDFPAVAAHPVFRPVYGDGRDFEKIENGTKVITNGAFRLVSIDNGGLAFEKEPTYWNAENVKLEKVKMIPSANAEKALTAYQSGEVDAVTNANFEPLAVKLLVPFQDFRRVTHSALNFYEFNQNHQPFDDRRVREALTISIDRERLTKDELDGVSEPAKNFLPLWQDEEVKMDLEKARQLLREAGFANGEGFPVIKLLVNRNDTQRRVAKVISQMWKRNLNVNTEIIVKDKNEFDSLIASGDFDLVRRGVVLPTTSESVNLLTLFKKPNRNETENENSEISQNPSIETEKTTSASDNESNANNTAGKTPYSLKNLPELSPFDKEPEQNVPTATPVLSKETILTKEKAIEELPAIPLYFSTSFSLVKPYIQGFDTNLLDASSLKTVEIETNWREK
jgi:oligopeptide transport system substrate-binding protein